MDSLDIFEDIFEQLTGITSDGTISATNETIEGLWFDSGIKKNTGETFYWTTLGDEIVPGVYPVAQLGSIVEVPVGKFISTSEAPGVYTMDRVPLFISHSKTAIWVEPGNYATNLNGSYNTIDPPIYKATHNQAINPPYSNGWSSLPQVNSYPTGYNSQLYVWNETRGEYPSTPTALVGISNISINIPAANLLRSMSVNEVWQHTSVMAGGPADLSRIYAPYMYTATRGDNQYIKCIIVRDDEARALKVVPFYSGFSIWVNNDANDEYNLDCTLGLGSFIASISYDVLNNEAYFDPEEDQGDVRPDPSRPDYEGDTSSTGGGKGNYINYPSDDIGLPELPTVSAIDTGFLTMYHPSSASLQTLVNYLWTSDWLETVKKMVSNPMDAIISLQLAPYNINDVVTSSCKIGAVNTQIPMGKVTSQYQILNCGSVRIPEHWGNALDYSNVNISINLPFCGIRNLDTNLLMNSEVGLAYYVDLLTGSAIAMLIVRKTGTSQSVYYTFDCNLNYQIPVTGANYAETMKALLSLSASSVGLGASLATGNVGGAMTAGASMIGSAFMAGSGACHYEGSGNLSANTGILGQFVPYIIVELPKQALPRDFKHVKGYTSHITSRLGSLSGYTEVSQVHVENITRASDQEQQMIKNLLMGGVIL